MSLKTNDNNTADNLHLQDVGVFLCFILFCGFVSFSFLSIDSSVVLEFSFYW